MGICGATNLKKAMQRSRIESLKAMYCNPISDLVLEDIVLDFIEGRKSLLLNSEKVVFKAKRKVRKKRKYSLNQIMKAIMGLYFLDHGHKGFIKVAILYNEGEDKS